MLLLMLPVVHSRSNTTTRTTRRKRANEQIMKISRASTSNGDTIVQGHAHVIHVSQTQTTARLLTKTMSWVSIIPYDVTDQVPGI